MSFLTSLLETYQREMFPAEKSTATSTGSTPSTSTNEKAPFNASNLNVNTPHHRGGGGGGGHQRTPSHIIETTTNEVRIQSPNPAVLRHTHLDLSPLDTANLSSNTTTTNNSSNSKNGPTTPNEKMPISATDPELETDPFSFTDPAPDATLMVETPNFGDDELEGEGDGDAGVGDRRKDPFRDYFHVPAPVETTPEKPQRVVAAPDAAVLQRRVG